MSCNYSRYTIHKISLLYSSYLIIVSLFFVDFYRGKTVFKHWLPGLCYRNITFQLISEATVNKSTMIRHSDITHRPLQHRTGTDPGNTFFQLYILFTLLPLTQEQAIHITKQNHLEIGLHLHIHTDEIPIYLYILGLHD